LLWLFWRWSSQSICPCWLRSAILPISASQVASISGMSCLCPVWENVSSHTLPRRSVKMDIILVVEFQVSVEVLFEGPFETFYFFSIIHCSKSLLSPWARPELGLQALWMWRHFTAHDWPRREELLAHPGIAFTSCGCSGMNKCSEASGAFVVSDSEPEGLVAPNPAWICFGWLGVCP
jgi:hypothetical protein